MTREDLLVAIEKRQFRLVFQPKIDCISRRLTGFEALVRWDHPEKGLVMPDEFIPLSESLGLIGEVTEQIILLALEWYAATKEVHGTTLSINLSDQTIVDSNFAGWLNQACDEASVPQDAIILEFSVKASLKDLPTSRAAFSRLQGYGFGVSIDHFGLGDETVESVAALPITELKVDKTISISGGLGMEYRSRIESIVNAAHSRSLPVVVEGIEDRDTMQYLRAVGCEGAQGYYIACPMGGDIVPEWLAAHNESREKHLL